MLSKILNFLFGKEPDIFDDKGHVYHKLSKKKWDNWMNRFIHGKEYNWREHAGLQAGANKPKTNGK